VSHREDYWLKSGPVEFHEFLRFSLVNQLVLASTHLLRLFNFGVLAELGLSIFICLFSGKDFNIDYLSLYSWFGIGGGILELTHLLPKNSARQLSSGSQSHSPLGVTLPTKIIPGLTLVPMQIVPSSSR